MSPNEIWKEFLPQYLTKLHLIRLLTWSGADDGVAEGSEVLANEYSPDPLD